MKILFSMRHLGFARNFESVLRLLAERGHRVHVVYDGGGKFGESRLVERMAAEYPTISHEPAPINKPVIRTTIDYSWIALATAVRKSLDYLQYLHPRFRSAPRLRARAEEHAPPLYGRLARLPLLRSRLGLRLQTAALRTVERAIPGNPRIDELIAERKPDLVLVTPLLWFASSQVDYVRSARTHRVRSVLCVGSWDHLTTKGAVYECPDLLTVWNEAQKQEAGELHGVPPERVAVTGAQIYDHWFGWPPRPRAELCRQVGLPSERPYLLYVCSSPFIAPVEVKIIEQWVRALRSSADPALRAAGVLVRPHPQNAKQWAKADLSSYPDVVVWPRAGANPIDSGSRADFFDSLYHSAAVVGINTSAQIEAGIVGRPVYTILTPEFAGTQEGTLHFHHLADAESGLLHVARDFDEHLAQLSALFAGEAVDAEEATRRFVESFVRPHGLRVPATPIFVDTLEQLAHQKRPAAVRTPRRLRVLRALLVPWAIVADVALEVERRRRHGGSARFVGVLGEKLGAAIGRLVAAARSGLRRVTALGGWAGRRAAPAPERPLAVKEPKLKPRVEEEAPGSVARLAKKEKKDKGKGAAPELVAAALKKKEKKAKPEAQPVAAGERRVEQPLADAGAAPTARAAEPPSVARPAEPAEGKAKKALRPDRLALDALSQVLSRLVQSRRPIVAGPWLSEVGFELLYWIPFLQWAKTYADIRPEQLVVLSRGGVGSWYGHVSSTYADIFDFVSPEEFRVRNAERMGIHRGVQKQIGISPFEQELIDKARQSLGLGEVAILHPGLMYEAFTPFWRRETSSALVEALTSYRVLPRTEAVDLSGALPRDFIAVKFYSNNSLPDTSENQAFLAGLLADLTRRSDVVLLDTGLLVDDHHDFKTVTRERLHTIEKLVTPVNNLAVQTQVISGARAFVGTYGGFSYLAPLQQVDSLAFYSHPKHFLTHHLELAKRVFEEQQFGSFVALDVRDTKLMRLALGPAAVAGLLEGSEKAA